MKSLFLAGTLLVTSHAYAADETHISVVVKYDNYRVRPQPGLKHGSRKYDFVLHPDGSIDDKITRDGKHGKNSETKGKLGKGLRVLDETTLVRKRESKDHIVTLTIKVAGKTCSANIITELKPGFTEFESTSTQLGVTAFYRDWRMTSSTCSIR